MPFTDARGRPEIVTDPAFKTGLVPVTVIAGPPAAAVLQPDETGDDTPASRDR